MQTPEQEIESSVKAVLAPWIEAEHARTWPKHQLRFYAEEFGRFAGWAHSCGLTLPANGHIIAAYLLEMVADGATLRQLERSADAIAFHYATHRTYLDPQPISAALALVAAQTAPIGF
jgi:hypothetical protein